ncbi:MAG: DUF6753 family protein [Xenococcaceae cyanobacterium]
MSRLNGKASEVLDAILSSESPEVRAKVYEIINVSGLEADDPMFLILALTGQMRVFLEAAPAELSMLLTEWKTQNARSLEEITDATLRIKETQQQQADSIKKNLEIVSDKCVSDIKEAGMAATSAIAEANSETLAKARQARTETEQLKEEIKALRAVVEADRQTNEVVLKHLLEQTGQNIKELKQAGREVNRSGAVIKKLQQDTVWIKLADWISPLWALLIAGLIGFGVSWRLMSIKYNSTINVMGREIMGWNLDRLIKCRNDKNPKCTFWIVPPSQRK